MKVEESVSPDHMSAAEYTRLSWLRDDESVNNVGTSR